MSATRNGRLLISLAVAAGALLGPIAQAAAPLAKATARTVIDYYYLLPDDYFEIKRAERKTLLSPDNKPVIDIPHGYMLAPGDGAQPTLELALFKKKNGEYILGICHNWDEETDTFLDFFACSGNKLVKLAGVLPEKINRDLVYKLPRAGTTIEVRKQSGKLLHSFAWTGEKFERTK